MNIITGATGVTHVTSNNDGEFNQAIFGDGLVVLANGNQLDAEIVNNNLIAVKDGDLVMQGRHALIEPGTTDEIAIGTGSAETNRNDLIVARYKLDNLTGYESLTLEVIEGTESSGAAVDPDYTDGVIRTGSTLVEYPLYRVRIEGINIVGLDKLFEPIKNIIDGVGEIGDTDISKIGDGTITGAIGAVSASLANFDVEGTSIPAGTSLGEFCTMLAKKLFPAMFDFISKMVAFNVKTGDTNGLSGSTTSASIVLRKQSNTGSYVYGYITHSDWIDITNFNTFKIVGTAYAFSENGASIGHSIDLVDENGATISVYSKSATSTINQSINNTIDISNKRGKYKVRFRVGSNWNWNNQFTITTMKFE